MITIVSGLPRSGTSLIMQMLEAGGIDILTDGLREADQDNPRGYYEFERVKKLHTGDTAWLDKAEGKVVKVVSALLKYLPSNRAYKVIFIRRNISEILMSQRAMLKRMGKEDDTSDAEIAKIFEEHLRTVTEWLKAKDHIKTLHMSFNAILSEPLINAERLACFFDSYVDIRSMAEAVDGELYRQRV